MADIEVQVDHGLPEMEFREAFARRHEVTARASQLGLIEQANRQVFHRRGFALTRDPETGDLWLTPTADPEGWSYAPGAAEADREPTDG
jgi:hypothetical protein